MRLLKVWKAPNFVNYKEFLQFQALLVDDCRSTRRNHLIVMQHLPCFTAGRRIQCTASDQLELCHPLYKVRMKSLSFRFKVDRGGQLTYHGPGQLVFYPILDLDQFQKSLHWYVASLEKVMIQTCISLGLQESRLSVDRQAVGIWVDGRKKVGFIGFHNSRWITSFGASLNLSEEAMPPFRQIVPCGMNDVFISSIESETGRKVAREMAEIKLIEQFISVFQCLDSA